MQQIPNVWWCPKHGKIHEGPPGAFNHQPPHWGQMQPVYREDDQ